MGAEASSASYADLQYIQQELRFSLRLCQQYRWPVVNVTGKAVEESASEIINLVAPHPRSIAEKT
jgi:regulator of PEP synthase PpsR (kinase-PPPase family)